MSFKHKAAAAATMAALLGVAGTAHATFQGRDAMGAPTGDGGAAAGALNQYLSIWNSVGSSFAGLSGQFDGVQSGNYWSGTVFAPSPRGAWGFVRFGLFSGVWGTSPGTVNPVD